MNLRELELQLTARKKSAEDMINELRKENILVKDKNINMI